MEKGEISLEEAIDELKKELTRLKVQKRQLESSVTSTRKRLNLTQEEEETLRKVIDDIKKRETKLNKKATKMDDKLSKLREEILKVDEIKEDLERV